MNYFKPDKYYYIIPILRIDNWLMVSENKSLYTYVNDNFPVLRKLEDGKNEILYNRCSNSLTPTSICSEYKEICKTIEFSLEKLGLPPYILAIGDLVEAKEVATGKKIQSLYNNIHTLNAYRVSDCDLEKYYIENYEDKAKCFFSPDEITLKEAKKSKEDFLMELNFPIKKKKRK